ncbi:hypothetical protein Tco_1321260 [Tanacetum coccineum]
MADLKFVDQHNMVACLEKTAENDEFHQIVDFLSTCLINYALTRGMGKVDKTDSHFSSNKYRKRMLLLMARLSVRSDILFNDEDGKRKSSISHPRRRIYRQVESFDDDLDEEDASKLGRESDKTKSMFQDSYFDVLDDDMEDVERETIHTATTRVSAVSAPVTTTGVAISTAEPRTPPTIATTAFINEDLTIAQTLIKMKEEKAKDKGVAIKDVEYSPRPIRSITTLQPLPTIDPKDKGKGVLVEEEPKKPEKVKRRDQGLDEIESDAELAQRLHEEELEELDRAQKERQKKDKRKKKLLKQLAAERAEAIRNKPPTRTQVRSRVITYLKHIGKYTHQQLKHKNFEEVQKLYIREKKWIDDFKHMDDDSQQQAESTKNRPRVDSEEESSKKQKLEKDNDAEKEELRDSMDVVPRDDFAIDVESLATKYPIVDWKTHTLNEKMMYYQIIRADRSSKNYKILSEMLDDFDRQYVIDLHRLTLFEPNEEDEIWKNQQDYNLISWRLFDSCGVHVLLMNTGVAIHMMIEKKYPLTQEMLSRMLNRRLEVNYESEMAFELLRWEDCWELKASEVTTVSSGSFGLLPLAVHGDLAEGITLGLEFLLISCVFFLASSSKDIDFSSRLYLSHWLFIIYGSDASSTCASFPNLLLVSCSFDYVLLLSVSTKLASNDDIMDAPPRPLNPLPLQSHPSLDITLSLSPITPLDHILDTPLPPLP